MDYLSAWARAMPWTDRAACVVPPHDTLPWTLELSEGRENPPAVVKMLLVCFRCPVRHECLTFALEQTESNCYGVWGGATLTERRRLMPSRDSEEMIYRNTRNARVGEIHRLLTDTLPARILGWEKLAADYRAERDRTAPERNRRALEQRLAKKAGVLSVRSPS